MPDLIVQMGHCYRTSGATGTKGEQPFATAVADACVRLLHNKQGWRIRPTLADVDDYRAAAFVAVHCDGANSPSARGASVGYQTAEGQAFAHAWKRAYAARGWPSFRPDNYTVALAKYYGVTKAVAHGTRAAMIIECGFLTSPEDRALLLGPGGADRVALAIGDVLGTNHEPTHPQEPDMGTYILHGGTPGSSTLEGTNIYWCQGPFFIGLDGGPRTDAVNAITQRGAAYQWVDAPTVTALDQRSHALYDTGGMASTLGLLLSGQSLITGQLSDMVGLLAQLVGQGQTESESTS